jgi:palmitoyltransferase
MRAFRGCSALVIRCFKKVEAFADWLTGAAGPFFVFFCWSLIILGGVAFCEIIHSSLIFDASIM